MDYEKLYKAFYLQVYSYTISLAKNREIAEEITLNTFYKAVSTTSQFKGKSDELTWLCSTAKNLCHDEMRSRQRIADVREINALPSNENVENAVTDSDMAFRIHLVLHLPVSERLNLTHTLTHPCVYQSHSLHLKHKSALKSQKRLSNALFAWPARRDSNPRPSESESAAISSFATGGY